jgi:hypothetical protein
LNQTSVIRDRDNQQWVSLLSQVGQVQHGNPEFSAVEFDLYNLVSDVVKRVGENAER